MSNEQIWKRMNNSKARTYTHDGGDELLFIMDSGFEGKYIVVREDAYDTELSVNRYTPSEIKEKFNIEI
jgi:hypothetical protein